LKSPIDGSEMPKAEKRESMVGTTSANLKRLELEREKLKMQKEEKVAAGGPLEKLIEQIDNLEVKTAAKAMLARLMELPMDEPVLESLQLEAQLWRTIAARGRGSKETLRRCKDGLEILQKLSRLRSAFLEQKEIEKLRADVDIIIRENKALQEVVENHLGKERLNKILNEARLDRS